jgi:hypothetical protein
MKSLSAEQLQALLSTLEIRFNKHKHRHTDMDWQQVRSRIEKQPEKMWSIHQMETSGGEPDVTGLDETTGEIILTDCAAESPKGRRSLCYDRKALDSRKEFKPADTAIDMAAAMGIELLTEAQYRQLQLLGEFDTKTSSWVVTPDAIRNEGGAIFCDRRYKHVFTYHNGAESYYAARGFRGRIKV